MSASLPSVVTMRMGMSFCARTARQMEKPVRPREHQVEQNPVKRTLERRALTVGAVCADGDGAAAQLEIVALDGGNVGIVLDNQYFIHVRPPLQGAA